VRTHAPTRARAEAGREGELDCGSCAQGGRPKHMRPLRAHARAYAREGRGRSGGVKSLAVRGLDAAGKRIRTPFRAHSRASA